VAATEEAASAVALAYQSSVVTLSGRLSAVLATLWASVDLASVEASWGSRLGEAAGAFTAAQTAAAGMADGYVESALVSQDVNLPPAGTVAPEAFSGVAASGLAPEELLRIPAVRALGLLRQGAPPDVVRRAGGHALSMYAATEVADAARLSTQTAMASRRVGGYIRIVGARCCSRCAILSGRWYRWSSGFRRHPRCRCVSLPAHHPSAVEAPDPMRLWREGRITDLTGDERHALDLGADLGQVVNSRRGLYVAGGHEYTREGTTRRGIAGARILARDIARAGGASPGGVYTNFTTTRAEVAAATAKYGPVMRRGIPFQRRTPTGRTTSAYRYTRSGRMSVSEILRTSTSRDDAIRQMINHGYILRLP
jgi:hypothetical protein